MRPTRPFVTVWRFLARSSAHMGEPTLGDLESVAGLAEQAANAYKKAADELPTREQLAVTITGEPVRPDLYAADAGASGASASPSGVRGA